MVVSAIVSYIGTPAAGKIVGSVLMGISAYGTARVQAKASGSSTVASVLYGIASGTSESVTEYFLGAIPGIGKETSSYLASILKEGGQEFVQEYLDAGYRAVLLGERIDLTELNEQAFNSFIMGMVVSGILNGGQRVFAITVGGVKYLIDSKKVEAAIQNGEVISADNIENFKATDNESVNDIMKNHHVSEEIATIMFDL